MKNGIVLYCFFCYFCPLVGQISMDSIYETAYLQDVFHEAQNEGDSMVLGIAAFQLHRNLNKNIEQAQNLHLLTLSIDCFAAVGDSLHYFQARTKLRGYYFETKSYDELIRELQVNLAYYERNNNLRMQVHSLFSLARAYNYSDDIEQSKMYYSKSLVLNEIVKDTLIEILSSIGQLRNFQNNGQYQQAISYGKKAMELSLITNNLKWQLTSAFHLGENYEAIKEYETAIEYLKFVSDREKIKPLSELKASSYKHLAQCYEKQNNYQTAHYFALQYALLSDSIWTQKREEDLDKLTIEYASKQKQAAIEHLEHENSLQEKANKQKKVMLLGLSIIAGLLLFSLFLLIRFYRDKIRKDKILAIQNKKLNQQKIESLEAEMQLTAIKSMLEGQEKERIRIARDLHDSLGGTLSTIKLKLNSSDKNEEQLSILLDKASAEVRTIAHNLQPNALQELGLVAAITDLVNHNKHENHLPEINFQHYNIPNQIENGKALQLYRIVQEALNNAIKHANANEILIQLNGEADGVSLLIEDDGDGFNPEQETKGNGLENLRKRAKFLQTDLIIDSSEMGTTLFLSCNLP